MGTVLIRADGSPVLGMGHISRCLALAHALQERGVAARFVCRRFDERVGRRITVSGFEVVEVEPDLSLHADAGLLEELADRFSAGGVVIDISHRETAAQPAAYTAYLHDAASARRTLIVDDLTRVVFPRALVVNPTAGVDSAEYDRRHEPTLLLGPRYALLPAQYRDSAARRAGSSGRIGRVAVCLGGGAIRGEFLRTVLRGLRQALGPELSLQIAAGMEGEGAGIPDELRAFTGSSTILHDVPDLSVLFAWADLAVVSGGVTKFEAAAMGTPSVMVAMIEHQIAWADGFGRTGGAVYAGYAPDLTAEAVAAVCGRLQDPAERRRISARAAAVVDGWGASRVAAAFDGGRSDQVPLPAAPSRGTDLPGRVP